MIFFCENFLKMTIFYITQTITTRIGDKKGFKKKTITTGIGDKKGLEQGNNNYRDCILERIFWFPRAGVNAINLRRANTQIRPYSQ